MSEVEDQHYRKSVQIVRSAREMISLGLRLSLPLSLACVTVLACSKSETACDPGTDPNCESATSTFISSDTPDPSVVGQEVTVKFEVNTAQGTPTGMVEVTSDEGAVERCSASVALGECTIRLSAAGSQSLRANYLGGGGYEGSSDSEPHQVGKSATTTVLESHTPQPSVVGQPIVVSFAVSAAPPGSGTPTGMVTVSDGTDGCTVKARRGECSFTPTNSGSKPLTVTYLGDETFEGSSDTDTHNVGVASTTTAIVSDSPDPSPAGQPYEVRFSVTINDPGSGEPTGTVSVSDGELGNCQASVAEGSCSLTSARIGEKTLTAVYAGNSSFGGSRDSVPHTVISANTTVTLDDQPDPSVVGEEITVDFAVSANGGTPTGNVTISVDDGTDTACTATVAEGSCDLVLLVAGEWILSAFYEGDGNFEPGAGSAPHTVTKAETRLQITSDEPDPSSVGQPVTVEFTLEVLDPGAGTPTGNVVVSRGTANCQVPAAATGSCQLTPTTAGGQSISATYAGDANYFGDSDTEGHVVQAGSTTVTITSDNPDPSLVGQPVQVTYTVSGEGGGTPTGTVTVEVNDGSGATCSSSVGAGGCTLLLTRAGSKTLTARYSGDANFDEGTGTASHQVNKASTTTTITSDSPEPSVVGQAVTVTFTVSTVAPAAGTPTGLVIVSDGSVTCNANLSGGVGSCQLTPITPGNKTLTATYQGTADFQGSSGNAPHVVLQGQTTLLITKDDPDPSVVGEKVTVEWEVTSGSGSNPTGTVTVTVNDASGDNCTASVQAKKCQITLTRAGSKTLTASYTGDSNNAPASATELHQVNRAATQTNITSDEPDASVVGQSVTVTFTVSPVSPGDGNPTGNVSVTDGTANCSAPVSQGNCTLIPRTAGAKTLVANYSGDANFLNSTDNDEQHQVNPAQTSTQIISHPEGVVGQPVTVNVSVTVNAPGSGPPTGTVSVTYGSLSCNINLTSGSGGQGSCTITPTAVGSNLLTATFIANANFGVSSDSETHDVNQAQTTTAIVSHLPDPSLVGQSVTVLFSVSVVAPGSGTPDGTVTIVGGTGCSALVSVGSCSLTFSSAGPKTLTASYAGNPNFAASTSPQVNHQVN